MDQLPLEKFWKSIIELLVCQNSCIVSFVKSWLLVGKCWLWEKGGVFEIRGQISLEWLSLCFNMCVWLRDRDLSLICKNKPSGGKGWSIYAKIWIKINLSFIWSDIALVLVALCCVGINHQKGGDWKGNVPLGHF